MDLSLTDHSPFVTICFQLDDSIHLADPDSRHPSKLPPLPASRLSISFYRKPPQTNISSLRRHHVYGSSTSLDA